MKGEFTYQGHRFTPFMMLRGGADRWEYKSKNVTTERVLIDRHHWNYEDFYAASTDKKCDLFECDGRLWIPATNYLFLWTGKENELLYLLDL